MPRKSLKHAKRTTSGWRFSELKSLYKAEGFVIGKRKRSPHWKVYHSEYPHLLTFVPNHTTVLECYIEMAISLIEQARTLKGEK